MTEPTFDFDIRHYPILPSTNTYAKELAGAGAPEWTVIIADQQTKGRGRLGRSFYSPKGSGLYMSVILRPLLAPSHALRITTAAAVSVAQAIEAISGKCAQIKWVNDIYINGKKVCGILTERITQRDSSLSAVILGIGVNVFMPEDDFPPELSSIAGSIFSASHAPQNIAEMRTRFAHEILHRFREKYRDLMHESIYQEYKKRLFILGQPIEVVRQEHSCIAVPLDLTPDFGLRVRYEEGNEEVLSSGEIRIRTIK